MSGAASAPWSGRKRLDRALHAAAAEECRADHAAAVAARHEAAIPTDPAFGRHHAGLARIHRRSEARHRTTAELYRAYARLLARQSEWPDDQTSGSFMEAVGTLAGTPSAAVVFSDDHSRELGVLASDDTSRTAQEWEFSLGEGPAHDSRTGGPLRVVSTQIWRRWPQYGPIVRELGIHSILAVPLGAQRSRLGSLVAFGAARRAEDGDVTRLSEVGDAFVQILIGAPRGEPANDIASLIAADLDPHPIVHQAAGILAELLACSTDDALARLRARAFVEGIELTALARRVADGDMREAFDY